MCSEEQPHQQFWTKGQTTGTAVVNMIHARRISSSNKRWSQRRLNLLHNARTQGPRSDAVIQEQQQAMKKEHKLWTTGNISRGCIVPTSEANRSRQHLQFLSKVSAQLAKHSLCTNMLWQTHHTVYKKSECPGFWGWLTRSYEGVSVSDTLIDWV